jgi:hypothetical protein
MFEDAGQQSAARLFAGISLRCTLRFDATQVFSVVNAEVVITSELNPKRVKISISILNGWCFHAVKE